MNKKKNVCIITYDILAGGSELNAKKIIKYIDNNYYWISLGRKRNNNFLNLQRIKKIKFLNFRVFKISSILKDLSKFIKNNKINIIYAIGMYPSIIASILKFRHSYKLIITRRGVINLTEKLKYFYLFLFIYFCSDKIETNSENIFKKFKRTFFFRKKIYFINNLIEKNIYQRNAKNTFNKKNVTLGFALNIRPVKDPNLIKDVIDIICKKTNYKFLIAGRDKNNFWSNLAKKYPTRLRYMNFIDPKKMFYFYNSIDLLLMTSKSEGSPNVVLEALSNGVPTVSVPIKANEGIVINNYNGVIINNRDPNKFFNGVINAIRVRKKLSKNSKLYFKKKFDINKNLNKLRKIF
tara:strand:+ start:914 stop:1963 length:1050 start_codon:yes stop_codon:yes gene_type:complete